jgi:hypothetical protein
MDDQERLWKVQDQLGHFLGNHPWTEEYEEVDGELIVGWVIGGALRAYGFRVREIGDWEVARLSFVRRRVPPMSDTNNNDPLITRREFCQQGKFGTKPLQRIEARGEGPPAIENNTRLCSLSAKCNRRMVRGSHPNRRESCR